MEAKMNSPRKCHGVVLNGGLGNQLFQLAAVLANESISDISIELSLGTLREGTKTADLISELQIPIQYELHHERKLLLIKQKLANRVLVLGERTSKAQTIQLGFFLLLLEFLLLCTNGRYTKVITSRRMQRYSSGHYSRDCLLIGYFQTSQWASLPHVYEKLSRIRLINPNHIQEVQKFCRDYELGTGVHFRIGDYAFEPSLGILPISYYSKALQGALKNNTNLIVFSDSPDRAVEFVKRIVKSPFTLAPSTFTAAQTLELMRKCENLVIANSSLSWWGAFLGYTKKRTRKIVCPYPWFRELSFDPKLIPSTWDKVGSWAS